MQTVGEAADASMMRTARCWPPAAAAAGVSTSDNAVRAVATRSMCLVYQHGCRGSTY